MYNTASLTCQKHLSTGDKNIKAKVILMSRQECHAMLWIWKLDPNSDLQSLIFKIYSQSGQLPSPQSHRAERWALTSAITRSKMRSVGQQMTLNSPRQLPINSTHLDKNQATLLCIYRNPEGTPSRRVSQTVGRRMPAQKKKEIQQIKLRYIWNFRRDKTPRQSGMNSPFEFFFTLAHPVYKMWITQELNTLELWNKLHFEEKKNGEYIPCL